jgi:Uma2 family endonuclease
MMATIPKRRSGVTVLRGVPYSVYATLRDEPANDKLRMTYFDGTLELMSPEFQHEIGCRQLGLIVAILTSELDIPCTGARSTTFRRGGKGIKKGNGREPDESFYLANEPRIRGKRTINLDVDPPPDLWIEVDNRGNSRGRLPIYAALGVPEVWRYRVRRGELRFVRLVDGAYEPIDRSLALPMLTPALVLEALVLAADLPESRWLRRLREWVRERFAPGGEAQ